MTIRARTPLFCQEALVKEVEKVTGDMRFLDPNGRTVPLRVFAQALPVPIFSADRQKIQDGAGDTIEYREDGPEEAVFQCPWCTVKIDSGEVPEINGNQEVKFGICFGIFNDDPQNQGHKELLNLIFRVYERFAVNPVLDKQYTCTGKFQWGLAEEDTHPYFFGALATSFTFLGFWREVEHG